MRKMSATEASRNFKTLLDAVEEGESITITRGNVSIAEIGPAKEHSGRDLRLALAQLPHADNDLKNDIADAMSHLTPWEGNSWDDA